MEDDSHLHEDSPTLSPETSTDYARSLMEAYVERTNSSVAAGIPVSLEERQAWRKLLDTIDRDALGPTTSELFDTIMETMDRDVRFQARVELGRVARLEP